MTTPEPLFLTVEEVLAFHADQIRLFGGTDGIRMRASLESAVAMPQASFGGRYLHADLFEMAAAYASTSPKTNHSWMATSGQH